MDEALIKFALEAITAHIEKYPASADTIEGIHQWWIQWPGIPESINITLAALKHLEQAETMERRKIANREIWRIRTHLNNNSSH